MVIVGQPAPDFTATAFDPSLPPSSPFRPLSLSEYAGRWLVFFWYPADFTHVCPTEITALSDRLDEFTDLDCAVLGASTDSEQCHRAWASVPRDGNGIAGVSFPLFSDRTHAIARAYGVLMEAQGIALRGLFVVDPDSIVQHATINSLNVGRSVDETLRVLSAIQSGGLCPSDWKPGQKTL
jgi:peroxiredoxin (alkyl hydroperoxide reductase subunit C)